MRRRIESSTTDSLQSQTMGSSSKPLWLGERCSDHMLPSSNNAFSMGTPLYSELIRTRNPCQSTKNRRGTTILKTIHARHLPAGCSLCLSVSLSRCLLSDLTSTASPPLRNIAVAMCVTEFEPRHNAFLRPSETCGCFSPSSCGHHNTLPLFSAAATTRSIKTYSRGMEN
jgi:hypothetical protein